MLKFFIPLFAAGALYAQPFDLAPFARPCCSTDDYHLQTVFDYQHPTGVSARAGGGWAYGLQWAEERDISEVRVKFAARYDSSKVTVQYWFANWPYPAPRSHSIEDPVDDPWQGRWLEPKAAVACQGLECRFSFPPLTTAENPNAPHLPGLTYRRAIKFRLLFPDGARPAITAVQVFSTTQTKTFAFRVRFGDGSSAEAPKFEAWNGHVRNVQPIAGGADVRVEGATGGLPGSHDITVVKVRHGRQAFSFAPQDLAAGPMYLPDFDAWIARAGDDTALSKARFNRQARIRERLAVEPEQTYERATRDIPPLDPIERSGGRLMLPLATDASWQKFGLQWGGHVIISKRDTKAKGRELERLTWPEDRIVWRIGTGETPTFRDATDDSTLAQLEDYLPVGIARWKQGGLEYEEEAFATALAGPLDPEAPARSEQTPAVLMLRLRIRNSTAAANPAHVWVALKPGEPLRLDGAWLTAGASVRGRLQLPPGGAATIENCRDGAVVPALHVTAPVAGNQEISLYLAIPFVPGLSPAERAQLGKLDHQTERARVVDYWRGVTAGAVPFQVPESRFNTFASGLVARIRLSATKDPKSGLYMVPAASYHYLVYANEAAFQSQLLDVMGQADLAARYLKTQTELQGSTPLLGTFTGDQKGVYHGARVDEEYDYTATPYNLNHGTVLWTLTEHYFYTRDRAWLAKVAPSMKRAADWIIEQRQLTRQRLLSGEPCPEFGLLPAGHLEDNRDWGHWFSVNAYASAGLTGLAEALRETKDPDAARYQREARQYREELRAAVTRAREDAPVIRLRDNTWVPYVPTRTHQRLRLFGPLRVAYYSRYGAQSMPTFRLSATREVLYGPMILLETGIFGSNDPLASWVLDDWEDNTTMSEPLGLGVHGWVDEDYWFSRGGMVFQANLQNPVRTYVRRGEIPAAIRNLYNNFVACYYPSVNILTEEYRRWRYPSGPFFKVPDEAKFVHRLRDLLITEYDGDLHLARGVPSRWLAPGNQIVVKQAPTYYGPVSYTLRATESEIRGSVSLPARNPYRDAWISLRLPDNTAISGVTVGGKPAREADWVDGRIRLPKGVGPIELVVTTVKR